MKLFGLQIDRFGARSQLSVSELSEHMNVIYGPNGAGKSTLMQFIRWMLYGQEDDASRRFLFSAGGIRSAAGSISFQDRKGLRTFRRGGDETAWGTPWTPYLPLADVNSTNWNQPPLGWSPPQSSWNQPGRPITNSYVSDAVVPQVEVSLSAFDRFFNVSLDQAQDIASLLRGAKHEGFQFRHDPRQLARMEELKQRRQHHQLELQRLPAHLGSLESLKQRRGEILAAIERLRQEFLAQRSELDRQRQENQKAILAIESELRTPHLELQEAHAALEARQRQLIEEYQQWLMARRELMQRRQSQRRQLEAELQRWRESLQQVRGRIQFLQQQIVDHLDRPGWGTEPIDTEFYLRTLGHRLQDAEQDLGSSRRAFRYDRTIEHRSGSTSTFGVPTSSSLDSWGDFTAMAQALGGLRDGAQRLTDTIRRFQQVQENQAFRDELAPLVQVERELSTLIETLDRQRLALGEADLVSSEYPSLTNYGPKTTFEPGAVVWQNESLPEPSTITPAMIDALHDYRLRELQQRYDLATRRVRELEAELERLRLAARNLDAAWAQLTESPHVDARQREIAEIDQLIRRIEERSQWERALALMEDELRELQQQLGQSEIVAQASSILRQITEGEFVQVEVDDHERCRVTQAAVGYQANRLANAAGHAYDYDQLSRGTRDMVYLSLCLAIAAAYQRRGLQMPMILNDVFVNQDDSGTRALAQGLAEFSRNHQLFVFTCHDHVLAALRQAGSTDTRCFTLRPFEEKAEVPSFRSSFVPPMIVPPVSPVTRPEIATNPPTYRWVAEWHRHQPEVHSTASPQPTTVAPVPKAPVAVTTPSTPVVAVERPLAPPRVDDVIELDNWMPAFSVESRLAEVPVIKEDLVEFLHSIDIDFVHQFLALVPEVAEEQLRTHGITADVIQRRQRETLLMLYVGVSPLEAQLLVACGVPDPERLGRADEGVLMRRIETVLERPQAVEHFGTPRDFPVSRIRTWIRRARNAHDRGTNGMGGRVSRPFTMSVPPEHAPTPLRPTTQRSAPTSPLRVHGSPVTPKFYLEITDPIVDAPSIGPKMADRLHAIEVFTVADLLKAHPEALVQKLDDRRVTVEIVQQWQAQSQLVSRIPNLRGHDAQILVACGIQDPSQLAASQPERLLLQVTNFVETKEGQRVLRNGKRPDLEEVRTWITSAAQARQFRAA